MNTLGGYHDKCGGRILGKQLNLSEKPWCAEHPPHSSRYPPSVPWYSSGVLNTSLRTH